MKKIIARGGLFLWSNKNGIIDTIVSMFPQVIGLFTGLFTTIFIAKGLGPEGLGLYGLIVTLPAFLANISDLGVGQTTIRFASRAVAINDEDSLYSILRWSFRIRLLIIASLVLLSLVLVPFMTIVVWGRPEITALVFLYLVGTVFNVLAAIPSIYYQAKRKFIISSIIRSIQLFISFSVVLVIFLTDAWDLRLLVLSSVAAAIVAAFLFLFSIPSKAIYRSGPIRQIKLSFFRKGWIKEFIKIPSLPKNVRGENGDTIKSFTFYVMISSIVVSITMQLDFWVLGAFSINEEIGLYSAAVKFALPLLVFLGGVNTALWPRVSGALSKDSLKSLLVRVLKFSLIATFGGVLYAIFFPVLIPIVFGDRFSQGVFIGQLLSVRYCVSLLFIPFSMVGYGYGLAKHYWWMNIVQLISVFLIDFFFIPRYGAIAAASSLIVNELIGGIISMTLIFYTSKRVEQSS